MRWPMRSTDPIFSTSSTRVADGARACRRSGGRPVTLSDVMALLVIACQACHIGSGTR